MRTPKKRLTIAASLALAFAAIPAVTGLSPAHASTYCEYVAGPTPSAEVDINNDGNPEVRVPSLRDVAVCAQADVFVTGTPVRIEPCGWGFDCFRILVHLQAGVSLDGGLSLCRTIDGSPTCSNGHVGPWSYTSPDMDTICIGVDLNGEHPCSGGTILGFE